MLALSGIPLGLEFVFYGPDPNPCVTGLGDIIIADFSDYDKLTDFVAHVDVATAESEHIPAETLHAVERQGLLYPASNAIAIAQDRLREKQFIAGLDLPLPDFEVVADIAVLSDMLATLDNGLIIKTRFQGYDGKGQATIHPGDDNKKIQSVLDGLGKIDLIAEQRVKFTREVSQLGVRNRDGEIRFYALSENIHRKGILHTTTVRPNDSVSQQAQEYTQRIMQELDYVGVMCVEFFDCDGKLLINEIAPRVHNSGHWTIEGAVTSQFENHVRAILDMPLGSTQHCGISVMRNLVGDLPDVRAALEIDGAHVHIYGKEPRPGRKLGHITVCQSDDATLQRSLTSLNSLIA